MNVLVPLVLCSSTLFAGCASGTLANRSVDSNVDVAKVSTINRVASSHGVDVHWVSYPQRKAAATQAPPTVTPGDDGTSMILPIGT